MELSSFFCHIPLTLNSKGESERNYYCKDFVENYASRYTVCEGTRQKSCQIFTNTAKSLSDVERSNLGFLHSVGKDGGNGKTGANPQQ